VTAGGLESLAARYGYAAQRVLEAADGRPELARPIVEGLPDLLAEAPFSARHEQARSVADVLFRRTRLALLAAAPLRRPDGEIPRQVARALAPELGWDEQRVEREVERFERESAAEGISLGAVR
jgi:glycerol-3-phosphate dehydrogenase